MRRLLAAALSLALVSAYLPVPAAAAAQDEVAAKLPPNRPPKQDRPPLETPPSDGQQQDPLQPPTVKVPHSMSVVPPGAPIVVDSFSDFGGDTTPGDNICAHVPSGGWCTLRAAIQEANARPGADTIYLPAGTYTLALAGSGENSGATGDLDITDAVTIIGSGGNADADRTATIVQAQSMPDSDYDRVFHVNPLGSGAVAATFKAITIRYGKVPGASDVGSGGGIEFETNDGLDSLTLYNVVVDQNKTAGTGTAGGIDLYNANGTTAANVLIEKSVISTNETTSANGGGITAENVNLTIRDSTVTGNKAASTGNAQGGGLYLSGSLTTVTIERSLFYNNRTNATGSGGAIYTTSSGIAISNSTFSGNWAGSNGGAIQFGTGGTARTLTLTNVTLTGNTANTGNGGGIYRTSGTVTLHNTIAYGNTALTGNDINGAVNAASSYNIVGSESGSGLTNGTNGNKLGVNPLLSALGNWGGPTQSHKLLFGSPAIDAGDNTKVSGVLDQRGALRTADGADSDTTQTVDIGAVEAHPTVSDIGNQTSPATVAKAVPFYVGDAAQGVTITATSSNQSVVPDSNLVITNGTTYNPTLTVTGTSVGTATITVTVSAAGDTMTDTFVMTVTTPPKASNPTVTSATTNEDTQSTSGLVVTPNAADSSTVTHFKITGITNGRLYKTNGTTEITNGTFITKAEGAAGLKFTPAADFNGTGSFQVQAAYDAAGTGLSDPVTASITVSAVDDTPVAGPDTVSATTEDSPEIQITANLLANDLPGPVTATDEAGQTLSLTGATAGSGGSVRFAGGTIYFTPAANFHGNATFTYTVQDSGGKSATGTVTVPVTPVADQPVVLSSPTTPEDTQTASGIVIDRSPVDGAEVTHFQITGITNGKLYKSNGLTEIADGSFITVSEGNAGLKFTPAPDFNGVATFTVTASTSNSVAGLGGATTASVTVTAVNDAPTANADTLTDVAEDSGARTIPFATLTGNDSVGPGNEVGQTLTVAAVSNPIGGTVTIVGQDVVFTPTPNYNGAASFTYTVQDSGDAPNTNTATAAFTISPVNDAPTGGNDTLSAVDEDSAPRRIPFATLLANDSAGPADENGQTLTIASVGSPVGGTVTIDGTDVLFTLDANFQGVASFTYMVGDNGTTDGAPDPKTGTATVTFAVNGVAEAPHVTAATTAEDTKSATGLVITPDAADGASVTHYLITGITGGSLYKHDGTTQISNGDYITAAEGAAGLKFMPAANLNTPAGDTFGFTVQAALDGAGTGMSGGTAVSITVTEVNDAPTGVDDNPPGAIAEDYGTIIFDAGPLLANDSKGPANESGQTLTITAADNAVGGTVSVVGGNVLFTPAANFYGTASFRYTVTDNGTAGGAADPKSSTATVTFTITPAPDLPQITGATTAEDTQSASGLVVTPNALDGAEISHFVVTNITGGRLFKQDGTTELFVNDQITRAEGAAGLKFTPAADANGTGFSIALAAVDSGRSLTGPASTATITVTEVNDAPTGVNDTLPAVGEDSAPLAIAAATLTANDLTGPADEGAQALTVTAVTAITGGSVSLDAGTQTITFTPAADFYGTATFSYTLRDNGTTNGAADPKTGTATVSIPVSPAADKPSVTPAVTAEDTQSTTGLVITRNGSDGAEVTHFEITGITGGKLYLNDGVTEIANGSFITAAQAGAGLKFTPAADANSAAGDTFAFTVKAALDGSGAQISAGAAAQITVTAVNDRPAGVADTLANVAEDSGPWTIPFAALTGNDSAGPANESGQALTVSSVGNAVGGTVAIAGTDVIFTPTEQFNGTASFTYIVADNGTTDGNPDAKNALAPATVSFTVTPVNDAPVGADDVLTPTTEDFAPKSIPFADLLANDKPGPVGAADENGQSLTIVAVSNAVGGSAAIVGNEIIFTLTPNFYGPASFTYTVQDNGTPALTGTANASFVVDPSAEKPVISPTTTPEETISTTGLVITPDPADAGGVTHYRISGIAGGTLYLNDGTTAIQNGDMITVAQGAAGLKFTPAANANTPAGDEFGFMAQATLDAAGSGMSTGTWVAITVTEVNDAPTGADDDLTGNAGYAVAEDAAAKTFLAADLLANDSKGPANESGQTLSITAADSAVGGTVAVVGGNVLFTPAANFYGTATFRYTLTDNGTTNGAADAKSSTATVTFTVTPVADAPQITATTTPEDTQSTTGLVITRSAVDGAEVTHFEITGITGGTLYLNDGTTAIANGDFITAAQAGAGLKFTPAANANTPAGNTFTFTAKAALSGAGAEISSGTTASITVTEVNDAPTGVGETLAAVLEDSGAYRIPFGTLTANDLTGPANESGQALTIIAVTAITGGTVVIDGTDLVFTPAPNFYGTATFTYTVQDNGTTGGVAAPKTSTATVSVPVNPVADTPSITATTTAEETQSTTGLVITRNAADGAEVTHFEITGITGGKLYLSNGTTEIASGSFITAAQAGAGLKFTPAPDRNTPAGDTFTFTVKAALDGAGTQISGGTTASITVTEVNDAPTGVADTLADVAEESGPWTIPFAVLTANDVSGPADENGQARTVVAVGGAVGGTVGISGTDVIFTPNADFNGTASFRYTVEDNGTTNGAADPKTAAAPATVTFAVTPVNDAPIGADDVLTAVQEDAAPLTIAFADLLANDKTGPDTATDESTQTLTIVGVSNVVGGTATIADSDVIFTLTPNYHGPAGFTYTLQDSGTPALSHTAQVSFTVTPVADAPQITAATTPEDSQSTSGLVITRSAVDGAEVTHFQITGITGGTLYLNDGTTQLNNGDWITVAQGNAGLKFSPAPETNSPTGSTYGFTVKAALNTSGDGISTGTPVAITVTEVNDAPTGADDSLTAVAEDSAPRTILAADLLANDSKGPANENSQTLSITAADNAVGGTVAVVDGNVLFTPAPDFYGTASFRYTLTDNGTTNGAADAKSSTATVTFTVTPVADAPEITAATTPEETQSTTGLVISRNAVDGAEVTHFEITGITGGTLYLNDGTTAIADGDWITVAQGGAGLKFTPAANANTPAGNSFGFTARAALDGTGAAISGGTAATITVTEVNDTPTGVADTLAPVVEETGPWTIPFSTLLANDAVGPNENGQTLTVTAVSGAVGGTVAINGQNVIFTPDADFNGTASFTYTLTDDGTTDGAADPKSNTAVATFTVSEVNDAPAGTDDTLADVAEDSGPRTIPFAALLANDLTGPANEAAQTLTIVAVAHPVGGTVALDGTDVIFTPAPNYHGPAGFTYTLQDDGTTGGASAPLTATAKAGFAVTSVNDAPVAQDGSLTLLVGQTVKGIVTATDVDGDTLTYTVVDNPATGKVTMNANGTYVYHATRTGTDTFTFRANDGTDDSNLATVTVTTRERPNEAPALTITVTETETNDESVTVSGTAAPGATVIVGGITVEADANGRWSATVPLKNGTNEITAVSDGVSRTITVVRDSTPPPLTLTASTLTTDKETVELTAISEPGATIEIGGVYGGTRTAKLALGLNTFTATATDTAGNKTTATITVERVARVLFVDVTGHWAEATINRMVDLDIAWGYADNTFRPDAPVTRLDFAVMIARLLKLGPTAEPLTFTDLGEIPAWTRGPLAAALKAGIIKGKGAGLFDPYAPITRAEVAVMMTRALTYAGKDVTPGDATFADADQIPAWAHDQVKAAARYKLITGYEDGSFRPGNTTTRAEAVTLLARLMTATVK